MQGPCVRGPMVLAAIVLAGCTVSRVAGGEDDNAAASQSPPFAVAGYLPEWRYLQWTEEEQTWRWDALAEHVTHLIIFSIEVGADGSFQAMDRFPPASTMQRAVSAAEKHGTKLQICFGGNSRTNGFPQMVVSKKLRAKFIKRLVKLCKKHKLGGVDYNWEYPRDKKEWAGLFRLIVETREAFAASHDPTMVISMAYYPDKRQEALLARSKKTLDALDYMHMMSYDQQGQHSTWEFGKQAVDQGMAVLPAHKLTMGLPFYARDVRTGEWTTYEDVVKIHAKGTTLDPSVDQLGDRYFNGIDMIRKKTAYAKEHGLGGVMIWEVGQDNFMNNLRALDPTTALLPVITAEIGDHRVQRDKDDL
eukprot:m.19426 g.19426  ORF g.19426 m.19426 type:complete len:361 (+) comp3691_c0_seq2:52-1134(+)